MGEESNLVKHAKVELERAGYPAVADCEDGPDKWMQENLLQLLSVFSEQGHSGFSASYCISAFTKLAKFSLLAPLKEEDCTFNDDSTQCCQLSSLFKDENGFYYLDAIVFKEQNGSCFSGSSELADGSSVRSRQYVKFPFTPKTFYIDVVSTEWAGREQSEKKDGGGWWSHVVKDEGQLSEVFEYYNRKL